MFVESFDGTKIFYLFSHPSKSLPTLVFVHGWVNNLTTWNKEAEYFRAKGYGILQFDLRGHGQSDKPEAKSAYSFEAFAKDIYVVLEKEAIEDFILVGHSMGGMITLAFQKLFSNQAKALVLCDTTGKSIIQHRPEKVIAPFAKHVVDFILKHEKISKEHFSHLPDVDLTAHPRLPDQFIFLEGLRNTPMKSVFACLDSMLDFDFTPVLKKIALPTLVIEGEKDKLLPEIDSEELFEEIPYADIELIPKGKHFVNLEYSDVVDKYIERFLEAHIL